MCAEIASRRVTYQSQVCSPIFSYYHVHQLWLNQTACSSLSTIILRMDNTSQIVFTDILLVKSGRKKLGKNTEKEINAGILWLELIHSSGLLARCCDFIELHLYKTKLSTLRFYYQDWDFVIKVICRNFHSSFEYTWLLKLYWGRRRLEQEREKDLKCAFY